MLQMLFHASRVRRVCFSSCGGKHTDDIALKKRELATIHSEKNENIPLNSAKTKQNIPLEYRFRKITKTTTIEAKTDTTKPKHATATKTCDE